MVSSGEAGIFALLAVVLMLSVHLALRMRAIERRGIVPMRLNNKTTDPLLTQWAQIEALIALYRIVEGKEALPPMRRWAMSPDILLIIMNHILQYSPKRILECGGGTSTIMFAYAIRRLGNGGHIYTLENNPAIADGIRDELRRRKLDGFVTVLTAPLAARKYDALEGEFHWYGIERDQLPAQIDLLVVDGPYGKVNVNARYPAGPELLSHLSRDAHIFIDDAARPDEAQLPKLWRGLYPDLGVRDLRTEKGAIEMFFLDRAIEQFRPQQLK